MTWVEKKEAELIEKKWRGECWDQEDCEAWAYCENVLGESRWLDEQDQKYDEETARLERETN